MRLTTPLIIAAALLTAAPATAQNAADPANATDANAVGTTDVAANDIAVTDPAAVPGADNLAVPPATETTPLEPAPTPVEGNDGGFPWGLLGLLGLLGLIPRLRGGPPRS